MPMLQAALLCDSAQEYEGKMSVLGGFISILNGRSQLVDATNSVNFSNGVI